MINLSKLLKTNQSIDMCAFPGFCINNDNTSTTRLEHFVLNNTIFQDSEFSKLLGRVQIKTNNSRKNLNLKPVKQTTKKLRQL